MKNWLILAVGGLLLFSCSEENKEDELYDLLLVCYNDFYEANNVSASDTLLAFENFLIDEGHLRNNSGSAYRELLYYLKSNTYFKLPLKKIDFSNPILYENPSDLLYCVYYNYNVDSTEFLALNYYKCSDKIAQTIEENESIDVHQMFDAYLTYLDEEEITKPFVRESILQFFYRWYFTSKYNRDLQIPLEEHDSLQPVIEDEKDS